jgi:sugar (pentulose or hexulose) kinase/GNAT superfamily N-acetyltransferase
LTSVTVAAVDLGASGGRVMAGRVGTEGVELHEVYRFPNEPVAAGGTLYWDILRLYAEVRHGLATAASRFALAGIGIDSWGVDFGLLDASGALLGNPVHYRDARTTGVPARVHAMVPAADLYAVTGIQHLPFNTIYQLAATPMLPHAATLLLIPDLLAYWFTGEAGAEITNASTTSLLDVRAQAWAAEVIEKTGLPRRIFPPLRRPGEIIGPMTDPNGPGSPLPVIAVASHDTASAVAAVPAAGPDFAYISSGTWSLAGMELDAPVLTAASRAANFTNETGVDGTIRYLRNLTGLWLLQQSVRCWPGSSLDDLLADAAQVPRLRFVIDPDDPVFVPPGDMPGRIAAWLADRGEAVPAGPAETVRCVLDSMALAHRRAVADAQSLSGRHADVVHIVGGGARNALLCQLTADATGLPVIAGPAEATALGNVLVQARALGAAPGDLAGLRALTRSTLPLRSYSPAGDGAAWAAAEARITALAPLPGLPREHLSCSCRASSDHPRLEGQGFAAFYPDGSVQGSGFPSGWAGVRVLAVHPGAGGSGVARALLGACEHLAAEAAAPVLAIRTASFMTDAIAGYERLGYRRSPEFDGAEPARSVAQVRYVAQMYMTLRR